MVILFGAVKSAWEEVGAQEEPGKPRPSLRLSSLVRGGFYVPLTSGDRSVPVARVAAWDSVEDGEGSCRPRTGPFWSHALDARRTEQPGRRAGAALRCVRTRWL